MKQRKSRMTSQQISTEIQSLLRSTGRSGIERVIDYIGNSDFLTAGCHTHHRYTGGLARHSLEACRYALEHRGNLSESSVIIGSLLQDLCTSHSPEARGIHGHGRRSVGILGRVCRFHLNRDEYEAIKLHMHGDAREMDTNPLARLVWKADKMSAGHHVCLA